MHEPPLLFGDIGKKRHRRSCEAKSQFPQYQIFKEGLYSAM